MPESTVPVRVWDLPTRLFHWVLALSVVASIVTAKIGGAAMVWHFRLGYLAAGLLLFRIVWGLVGGRWSRFASFLYTPTRVWAYLRGQRDPVGRDEVGHSPLGALSVWALLGFLVAQVGSGLFADDEIANVGPLNRFVSGRTAQLLTGWHKEIGESVLIALLVLHVAAVLFYRWWRRQDLVTPMITGDKSLPAGTPASADGWRQRVAALVLALAVAMAVNWVVGLGG
jgi:cytochrome b